MMTLMTGLLMNATWAGVVPGDGAGLDEAYEPIRVAVLVGVEDYADPALQGLQFPAKDARDLAAVLGAETGGAFDRVVVIEGAEATTAEGIQRAIERASSDLQRDDTFVLYLSGHGTLTIDPLEGSQLWFLPSDGVLDSPENTGLGVDWLEAQVSELKARRRVLIMDTCHNGRSNSKSVLSGSTASVLQGMRGEPPAPRSLREVSESEARLFAAQYYQPAMEDPDLENGVYTHFLLRGLTDQSEAADLDRDGLVDVSEAHDYARDRTIRHTGGMQVPRAEYRIVGKEEIYLSGDPKKRRKAEKALVSACDDVLAKGRLMVDGQARGELPGLMAIEPGRHELAVETADGRTLVRRRVHLEAGDTLPLESLFEESESGLFLMAGPTYRLGPGKEHFHSLAGDVELSWFEPVSLPINLRSELHLRAATSRGPILEQGDWTVMAGELAVGGSAGWRRGGLSIGPVLELVVPWRNFENDAGQQQQGELSLALGGRMLWTHSLEAGRLVLRVDSRVIPFEHDEARTWLWHQGLALGWSPN
jgi:hypothetical protein